MAWMKGDLLCFREKVVWVPVESHLADTLHGDQFFRNKFCGIQQIEAEFLFVLFLDDLYPEFPFWIGAMFDRVPQVAPVKVRIFPIDFSFLTTSSVLFDAIYIPSGDKSIQALQQEDDAAEFVKEAYKHCKTIAATGAGGRFVRMACLGRDLAGGSEHEGVQNTMDDGLIIGKENDTRGVASKFINAMAHHRHWARELKAQPA